MRKLIVAMILVICPLTMVKAYSPDLILLGESKVGRYFIDRKATKTVAYGIKQAVIYEKFNRPVSIDVKSLYQSNIKYHYFDCMNRSVAIGSAKYYQGRTSNSVNVASFVLTTARNGDTGETTSGYQNAEFIEISALRRMGVQSFYITPYYIEAFNIVCK